MLLLRRTVLSCFACKIKNLGLNTVSVDPTKFAESGLITRIQLQPLHRLSFEGIVSRDWAELEMILLDRLEVFNISAPHFFKFCCRFNTVFLKMAA